VQIKRVRYLCQSLETLIQTTWEKLPIPDDELICKPERSPHFLEPIEITEWLSGRNFSEISNSNNFESQMPFYYLTDSVASYYLGGYLLKSCQNLSEGFNELGNSFGFDHLLDFISSGRFYSVFTLMNRDCRIILLAFIEMILIVSEELEVDPNISGGIQKFLNEQFKFPDKLNGTDVISQ
jgi:hypothetical protein